MVWVRLLLFFLKVRGLLGFSVIQWKNSNLLLWALSPAQGKPVYAGAKALLASDPEVDEDKKPYNIYTVGAGDSERPFPESQSGFTGGGQPGGGGTRPTAPSGGPYDDPNAGAVSQITIAQAARDGQTIGYSGQSDDNYVSSGVGTDPTQQSIEDGPSLESGYTSDPNAGRVSIPSTVMVLLDQQLELNPLMVHPQSHNQILLVPLTEMNRWMLINLNLNQVRVGHSLETTLRNKRV